MCRILGICVVTTLLLMGSSIYMVSGTSLKQCMRLVVLTLELDSIRVSVACFSGRKLPLRFQKPCLERNLPPLSYGPLSQSSREDGAATTEDDLNYFHQVLDLSVQATEWSYRGCKANVSFPSYPYSIGKAPLPVHVCPRLGPSL